ncbi:hypothetical protein TGPRC2_239795 [Toxoplasma gondii TgCatPRC2]|uniref:Uncharacterized protein n=5 Tax=Toxoplasma gondii TaxID=5811 RepID=A0A125YWD0_TOXGV|nr:hypothetical protein TGME49_239795 [Toxoplasma gondii ME49]ESS31343.1 hypothetical protein TGVEG_239795 [Toxoplasma gondii VEG]KFH14764.1 hypothetical protein TGMAS_239795 [Toxoplasma gondii MAS]KYK66159.1 hypothetical protein TGPRC2_239795 [Toxoplasma gondii TgCatPRC2]PIM02468.1 hypothetical protein TGCOUG_239795 [Toxoplasma gondii COUG]EPT30752.1 hypothetical protein TGME49_239795 [Toxoplasma gondii ME49]|eukprot:XP_018637645.1 hypothetical protein TGME49_239795 [Toxoplasma gondii ME49]
MESRLCDTPIAESSLREQKDPPGAASYPASMGVRLPRPTPPETAHNVTAVERRLLRLLPGSVPETRSREVYTVPREVRWEKETKSVPVDRPPERSGVREKSSSIKAAVCAATQSIIPARAPSYSSPPDTLFGADGTIRLQKVGGAATDELTSQGKSSSLMSELPGPSGPRDLQESIAKTSKEKVQTQNGLLSFTRADRATGDPLRDDAPVTCRITLSGLQDLNEIDLSAIARDNKQAYTGGDSLNMASGSSPRVLLTSCSASTGHCQLPDSQRHK